jgi:hypothetical protein
MFDKGDVRDPLRYIKAEMAKKFGETLTFGNNPPPTHNRTFGCSLGSTTR